MSSPTDLAGVIGTWVGAGLGFFALVGLVGPLLIWRATRTRRYKALERIGPKNHGYVSAGISVFPGVKMLRKLHAPDLRHPPVLRDKDWVGFDLTSIVPLPESPVTWVQFGACLQAYGLETKSLDKLEMLNDSFALPVHASYLFAFLVLGRYQESAEEKSNHDDLHLAVGNSFDVELTTPRHRQTIYDPSGHWRSEPDHRELHGLTGRLCFDELENVPRGWKPLHFTESLETCDKRISADHLHRPSLLMLAIGFLPLPSGRYVYYVSSGKQNHVDSDNDNNSDISDVELYNESDESSTSSESSASRNVAQYSRLSPMVMAKKKLRQRLAKYKLTAFKFEAKEFSSKTPALASSISKRRVLVLRPEEGNKILQAELQQLVAMTYIPPSSRWVRVETSHRKEGRRRSGKVDVRMAFVNRPDAQLAAMALLTMPWSSKNYVAHRGNDKLSILRQMLCTAAEVAIRLLQRIKTEIASLKLKTDQATKLLQAADAVFPRGKSGTQELYRLDEVLMELQHPISEAYYMVGILVLTNPEFQLFVYQSARHVSAASKTDTTLNLNSGEVLVQGAFGVTHTFYVDWKDVSIHLGPKFAHSQERMLRLSHANVLLATLKACIRSLLFSVCLDSEPIQQVMSNNEGVFMMY